MLIASSLFIKITIAVGFCNKLYHWSSSNDYCKKGIQHQIQTFRQQRIWSGRELISLGCLLYVVRTRNMSLCSCMTFIAGILMHVDMNIMLLGYTTFVQFNLLPSIVTNSPATRQRPRDKQTPAVTK
jgi:hypothetical protein